MCVGTTLFIRVENRSDNHNTLLLKPLLPLQTIGTTEAGWIAVSFGHSFRCDAICDVLL